MFHPCCSVCQNVIPFYGYITFHAVNFVHHLLVDIWMFPFWLLWLMLLQTCLQVSVWICVFTSLGSVPKSSPSSVLSLQYAVMRSNVGSHHQNQVSSGLERESPASTLSLPRSFNLFFCPSIPEGSNYKPTSNSGSFQNEPGDQASQGIPAQLESLF